MDNVDKTYKKYHSTVNMSYSELLRWSKSNCSLKASLDRRPIKRNLMLLSTPKDKWGNTQVREAKKVISFEARHSKAPAGKVVSNCGVSKRTIARKNWAVDPNKK
jgi:hypothetical protein